MPSLIKVPPMTEAKMSSTTTRDIGEQLKARLRGEAAQHGLSIGDEARDSLRAALSTDSIDLQHNLAESIRSRIEPLGGIDLEFPPRDGFGKEWTAAHDRS
ncbi:FitA-like ribbon-helix-helix domain-containing protein [Paraburkholderia xenovorans]|nr:plasmid stabilization protein [Paraburkholderia xenovorans]